MKIKLIVPLLSIIFLFGCKNLNNDINSNLSYLDYSNYDDKFLGGIKMIPIQTPKGDFKVWTKRVGNNPNIKVLLLHGGP